MIFHHPLAKGFGQDRALVPKAQSAFDVAQVLRRGGGDDPVDHAGGKGALRLDPSGEVGGVGLGIVADQSLQHHAIIRQVVARNQGQPAKTQGASFFEPSEQKGAKGRKGAIRPPAIAFFGDGEAGDANGPFGEGARHSLWVLSCDEDIFDRPDEADRALLAFAFRQAVETRLRVQRLGHGWRAHRDAGDQKIPVARIERGLGEGGLMRTVKGADAEMHNADRVFFARIVRPFNSRRRQVLRRQSHNL